jgi:glycerol dehydrogenase
LELGDRILLIVDKIAFSIVKEDLLESLKIRKFDLNIAEFKGECCREEIDRLKEIAVSKDANIVLGVGGGKALDTSKAVAREIGLSLVILPTIASTDAPCSSISVLYKKEGIFDKALYFSKSPDLVIVDSKVILLAPVRFLVAGMGDALSTGYEAEVCYKGRGQNSFGGSGLFGIINLARFCSKTILEYGLKAKIAVENSILTQDVERIIEANILLSGIGFESGGLAAAHAIADGLTAHSRTHNFLHGEKVAFGIISQLVLEGKHIKLIKRILDFYQKVGLPVCLAQLGIGDYDNEDILKIAEKSCDPSEPIYNMPMYVDKEIIKDTLIMADNMGKYFLEGKL